MAQNQPLQDHYATLNISRPTTPEVLFLAFRIEMLALSTLPNEKFGERFDQVSYALSFPSSSHDIHSVTTWEQVMDAYGTLKDATKREAYHRLWNMEYE
jgi:hypothetical protein